MSRARTSVLNTKSNQYILIEHALAEFKQELLKQFDYDYKNKLTPLQWNKLRKQLSDECKFNDIEKLVEVCFDSAKECEVLSLDKNEFINFLCNETVKLSHAKLGLNLPFENVWSYKTNDEQLQLTVDQFIFSTLEIEKLLQSLDVILNSYYEEIPHVVMEIKEKIFLFANENNFLKKPTTNIIKMIHDDLNSAFKKFLPEDNKDKKKSDNSTSPSVFNTVVTFFNKVSNSLSSPVKCAASLTDVVDRWHREINEKVINERKVYENLVNENELSESEVSESEEYDFVACRM